MWAKFSLILAGILSENKYLGYKWMLTEKSCFHLTQVNYLELILSLTNLVSSRNEHLVSLPKIQMSRSQTQKWWNWQVWFLRSVGHKGGACMNGIRDLGRELPCCFFHLRKHQEDCGLRNTRQVLVMPKIQLLLNSLTSRTVRKNCFWFEPARPWYFVIAFQMN